MMIGAGPQIETQYVLTGPDGTRAVFNNRLDPDYVGHLTNITGLDSAEVRESAEELVQFDGGIHGDFFYGRRPIVMEGLIYDHGTVAERNSRLARIQRATNAMRADALLEWTPDGGVPMFTTLRRQQPFRVEGAWNKTFQAAMVAADPRIYSVSLYQQSVAAGAAADIGFGFPLGFDVDFGAAPVVGQLILNNAGNAPTWPIFVIMGPGTNPSVSNLTTGLNVPLIYTLSSTEGMLIDTLNRTIHVAEQVVGDPDSLDLTTAVARYEALDFANVAWAPMDPGSNDFRLGYFSSSAGAKLTVSWRDAWL
jgi:hypothetical protein